MLRTSTFVVAFVVTATQPRAAELRAPLRTAAEAAAARTIKFTGGSATVERTGDREKVVVSDRNGKLVSESWCDQETGTYDELVTLFRQLQRAVVAKDRHSVASLVRFPLQVNGARHESIRGSAALLRRYEQIFANDVTKKIAEANAEAVFCRGGQAMLGDGVVWGHVDHGKVGIDVVNR
jgi:hypothetical protein